MDTPTVTAAVLDFSVFAVAVFCAFVLGGFTGAGYARARIRNAIRRRVADELADVDERLAAAERALADVQRIGPTPGEPVDVDHEAIARVLEHYRNEQEAAR